MQEDEYSDMREKFIEAQNDPEETQRLAISLSSICEEKYGIQIKKNVSDEILRSIYNTWGSASSRWWIYSIW